MKKAEKKWRERTVTARLGEIWCDTLLRPIGGDLQDGMLAYYNDQAPMADANVEAKLEKTPLTGLDLAGPWEKD